MGRRRGAIALAVATAVITALVLSAGSPVAAQSESATDQRVVSLLATYDIRPEDGAVVVVEQITVRNVKGNQRSGNTVTQFFWRGHEIWAPADAQDLSISVGGEELEWEIFDTVSGVLLIDAFYRSNLNFGQTRVIDVSYTLPTYPPGDGPRRLNGALFDLELLVCCNYEEIDITVTVPNSFVVMPPTNLRFVPGQSGGQQTFTFADDEVTGQFTEVLFTDWFGFDDAGLERSPVEVGGDSLELVYPPDDIDWASDTSQVIDSAGTELERLLGSGLPADDVVLQQGRNDDFGPYGVAGPFDEPVSVPRDASESQLASTMAHAWLIDAGFEDERIQTGLAAALGAAAAEAAEVTIVEPPEPTAATDPDERAFWVMRQISDEIGPEGLGRIVQQVGADETAYVGEDDPEGSATIAADWRRFVDLAQRRNGSATAADLLTTHLLTDDEAAQLETRSEAVTEFDRLASRAEGVMPVGIRTAMTNWDFEQAMSLMTAAEDVLDERERIVGDDDGRATDSGLALGQLWAQAESVEDLEAVQDSLLDRESALGRARLVRYLLVFVALAAVVGGALLFLLFRRRSATATAAPSPAGPGGAPFGVPPAVMTPPTAGVVSPVAPTWSPPPDGTGLETAIAQPPPSLSETQAAPMAGLDGPVVPVAGPDGPAVPVAGPDGATVAVPPSSPPGLAPDPGPAPGLASTSPAPPSAGPSSGVDPVADNDPDSDSDLEETMAVPPNVPPPTVTPAGDDGAADKPTPADGVTRPVAPPDLPPPSAP